MFGLRVGGGLCRVVRAPGSLLAGFCLGGLSVRRCMTRTEKNAPAIGSTHLPALDVDATQALGGEEPQPSFTSANVESAWLSKRPPANYWNDRAAQRNFFDWLMKKLGLRGMDDWYNVPLRQIRKHGGSGMMLCYYNDSVSMALKTIYPEHEWLEWKFCRAPRAFWAKRDNQVVFLDWVAKQLHLQSLDGWYNVAPSTVRELGGGHLLGIYQYSLINTLMAAYPTHEWLDWKFICTRKNFWDSAANRKKYCDWLFKELGLTNLNDWYSVSRSHFVKHMGKGLLMHMKGRSMIDIIKEAYPEHPWKPWSFDKLSHQFWLPAKNRKMFLDEIGQQFGVVQLSDWYRVSTQQVAGAGGRGMLRYTSLYDALQAAYPDHVFHKWKFLKGTPDTQT